MTQYDWLLIFLGGFIVVFLTIQRMARALFTLAITWAATLMSAVLYREAAYRIQAVAGKNPPLVRGIMFDVLLVIFVVVGFILIKVAFPVTKLPKLGILDHIMGAVLGAIVAIVIVALITNSMGVMVMDRWEANEEGWAKLRTTYMRSGLRPITSPFLSAYSYLFYPFFRTLPPALTPK